MATINGTSFDDQLTGTAGGDFLYGFAGNDRLDGGLGADTMEGGNGDDVYIVDNVSDIVTEAVNFGNDTVRTSLAAYSLPANVEWLEYAGPAGSSFAGTGNALYNVIIGGSGDDTLDGGIGNDSLEGLAGNDTYIVDHSGENVIEQENEGIDTVRTALTTWSLHSNVENLVYTGAAVRFTGNGNDLANRIEGGAGDDILNGYGGNDTLVGLAGNDLYYVHEAADAVVEAASQGYDTIYSYASLYTLPDHVERLAGLTAGFTGTGNALNNEILGSEGNDVLNGMAGVDVMWGGYGNDIFVVDHELDRAEESANAGTDRVNTTVAVYSLRADVEELVYVGDQAVAASLGGNDGDNFLQGGGAGDNIWGGAGADTMAGLGGDDLYWVDNAGDKVVEAANAGHDLVYVALNQYEMSANVEDATFNGNGAFKVWGNALDNRLEANNGADFLFGGAGADTMIGWGGDDVYYVDQVAGPGVAGDVVVETEWGGTDSVGVYVAAYTLADNVENLFNLNAVTVAFFGQGNGLVNALTGAAGSDTLDGAGGDDIMYGMKGDDTYWVDTFGDAAVEDAGNGSDWVRVADLHMWTLGDNLENLGYSGIANFQATGNALANRIETGAGDDQLRGEAGADILVGAYGNDVYFVDETLDAIVEHANEGTDNVMSTAAVYALSANIEGLFFAGDWMTNVSFTGNAGSNMLDAAGGDDFLDGGAGADTMSGRSGNDTYVVDHVGDVIVEQFGGGTDEVRTALGSRSDFTKMFVLADTLENLTGTSASGQGVYANAANNVVRMGAGGDLVVLHDGGDDAVESGGGNDFLYYGNALTAADGNDGGAGFDTVGLLGDYALTFAATSLIGIEKLAVYGSGPSGIGYDYALTTVDANVAAGKQLMVVAQSLGEYEKLTFNGAAEADGSFNVRGGKGADGIATGAGDDQLWGNLGADTLWGGAGNDQFEYHSVLESTWAARDQILDFGAGDKLNLKAIDADGNAANGNGKFAFIGDAAFSFAAGQLRAVETGGKWLVEADTNGDSIADLSILVTTTGGHDLAAADFWL